MSEVTGPCRAWLRPAGRKEFFAQSLMPGCSCSWSALVGSFL
jgi:hypothetical protein